MSHHVRFRFSRLSLAPLGLVCLLTLIHPAFAQQASPPDEKNLAVWKLPDPVFPPDNPYSAAKARLGRSLFFDPRLSHSRQTSCVSCHHPGLGWADGLERSMLAGIHAMPRHTPSLINIAYRKSYFWDGRAESLEQALSEHLQTIYRSRHELLEEVSEISGYRQDFAAAFGSPDISMQRICQALATFLRTIVQRDTRFDRWVGGEAQAISEAARRGFRLFTGKAGCIECHAPPAFSDGRFHRSHLNSIDPGRYEISHRPEDRQAFRTPPLREIARTAPYMHGGQKPDLESVIRYYDDMLRMQGANGLSDSEKQDLLAFLKSLSGPMPQVEIPNLPLR